MIYWWIIEVNGEFDLTRAAYMLCLCINFCRQYSLELVARFATMLLVLEKTGTKYFCRYSGLEISVCVYCYLQPLWVVALPTSHLYGEIELWIIWKTSEHLFCSVPMTCFSTYSCAYTQPLTLPSKVGKVDQSNYRSLIIETSGLLRLTLAVEAIGNVVCGV